jgi:hypothetical protein
MRKKWHVHYSFNVMSDWLLCCLDRRLQAVSESFLKGGLSYDVSQLYVTNPDNSYHMR